MLHLASNSEFTVFASAKELIFPIRFVCLFVVLTNWNHSLISTLLIIPVTCTCACRLPPVLLMPTSNPHLLHQHLIPTDLNQWWSCCWSMLLNNCGGFITINWQYALMKSAPNIYHPFPNWTIFGFKCLLQVALQFGGWYCCAVVHLYVIGALVFVLIDIHSFLVPWLGL